MCNREIAVHEERPRQIVNGIICRELLVMKDGAMIKMKPKGPILLAIFLLVSCAPVNMPTVTTETPGPNPLPVSTQNGLPVFEISELSVDHGYCDTPNMFLAPSNAQGLSEDEIVFELMQTWLTYFNHPQAPGYCQIGGFIIDDIYYDQRTPSLPLEPKGDINRVVHFSVRLVQYPNSWMSWSGEVDDDNWLHTGANSAVFCSEKGCTLKFAHP